MVILVWLVVYFEVIVILFCLELFLVIGVGCLGYGLEVGNGE